MSAPKKRYSEPVFTASTVEMVYLVRRWHGASVVGRLVNTMAFSTRRVANNYLKTVCDMVPNCSFDIVALPLLRAIRLKKVPAKEKNS